MANERQSINRAPLSTIEAPYVATIAATGMIRKDPAKGIQEDVEVPFVKKVFNIGSDVEAADVYDKLGEEVFNGMLNYAADLWMRGAATQAKRAELTTDPLKKEVKQVTGLLGEVKAEKFAELRRAGKSTEEALASLMAS